MNLDSIERRRETRHIAKGSILFQIEGIQASAPGQLVDLSACGAGIMTTDMNAPVLGEHVALEYKEHATDEDDPRVCHEKGIVVNIRHPERGIARIGVRFLQPNGEGAPASVPLDTLDMSKQPVATAAKGRLGHAWGIPTRLEPVGAN